MVILHREQPAAADNLEEPAEAGRGAFFFDQKGLMAGLGIQGTKVSRINP